MALGAQLVIVSIQTILLFTHDPCKRDGPHPLLHNAERLAVDEEPINTPAVRTQSPMHHARPWLVAIELGHQKSVAIQSNRKPRKR